MNLRKYVIIIAALGLIMTACQQEFIGQYPTDSVAPAPVTNVQVTPMPGGAHITYDLPKENDLLYISVSFTDKTGNQREERASAFTSEINIKGFGEAQEVDFYIKTVDRSMNMSEPVIIKSNVLRANIFDIAEQMTVEATWGGIKLEWINEIESDVIVSVTSPDATGKFREIGRFYSKSKYSKYFVRGMESVSTVFNITVRDIYNNITPPRVEELTPKFEVPLPIEEFLTINKSPLLKLPEYLVKDGGASDFPWIFNKDRQVQINVKDGYDSDASNKYEPYMPFDMQKIYRFSRFNMLGRTPYAYTLRNARIVELWGTVDENVVRKGPDNWEGWTCLGRYESVRPSGTDYTTTPTAEDKEYGNKYGDNFDVADDNLLPVGDGQPTELDVHARAETSCPDLPVRYVRIRGLSNWSGVKATMAIQFLQFWGEEVTEN